MKGRRLVGLVLAGMLTLAPARARGASAVFTGDPTDGGGTPYEILPGQPLVTAGLDGRLGTGDDVVNPAVRGDIDLVVRLGGVPATGAIPAPAPVRKAIATATAGLRGSGVAVPFTVYLSDGAVAGGQPYGALLAAADMVGLPVIVVLYADRDGDGVIGPRGKDPRRDVRSLAELESVGTEVALFDATGRASGSIVTTVGGPPSRGGVTLVATATAFTGNYDPEVLDGHVPTGPAITTAQPFVPERDPSRIFTDVGPLEVDGTLNPRLRAAAIPDPHGALALALAAKKPGPTIDMARAVAGPAVCVRVVEPARGKGLPAEPPSLALGTASSAGRAKLVIVAVDRFGNPTDPVPGMQARLVTDAPLAIVPDADAIPASETITLTGAKTTTLTLQVSGGGAGTLRVLVGGALCQTLAVDARPERNKGGSDALVALKGKADYRSLAAAAAGAVDRNGDGRITIHVADGVYRERVSVTRGVEVVGAGSGRTVVDAGGVGPALALASTAAELSGLTASGGTAGVLVTVPAVVTALEARGNVGAGFSLESGGATVSACAARENGGPGFAVTEPATLSGNRALDNAGAGIAASATTAGVVLDQNLVALNGLEGILVLNGAAPVVTGNAAAGNYGEGISLEETAGGTITANRAAGNDGDGLSLNQSDGALVDGNDCSRNHGYGMRIDRSTADFDAAPGSQPPPGTNDVSDNRKGEIDFR
ncbi:MAG: right-handed parallel beta-helix repeat-containing protein [Deltaproteobacteria bacterium]|nr:right-handed parallel beta-helix repeat-containing protein [Deltaproteobacteria bacterium]